MKTCTKETFAEGDAPSGGQHKEEESASVRLPRIHGRRELGNPAEKVPSSRHRGKTRTV